MWSRFLLTALGWQPLGFPMRRLRCAQGQTRCQPVAQAGPHLAFPVSLNLEVQRCLHLSEETASGERTVGAVCEFLGTNNKFCSLWTTTAGIWLLSALLSVVQLSTVASEPESSILAPREIVAQGLGESRAQAVRLLSGATWQNSSLLPSTVSYPGGDLACESQVPGRSPSQGGQSMAGPRPGCPGLRRQPGFPEMFLTSELFLDICGLCGQVEEVVQKARPASTGSRITRAPCGFVTSAL